MQVQKVSLRDMSILSFLSSSTSRLDADSAHNLRRQVQKGIFEEIWGRSNAKRSEAVQFQRTFANVGLLASTLFANHQGRLTQKFIKDLATRPVVGTIRTRVSFHDDIRFVATSISGNVYLILDNAATDSRMSTVMIYDTDAETFVDHNEALLDFVLNNEVVM